MPEPSRPPVSGGREALVVVFPSLAVIPVPAHAQTVGRNWLRAHKVEDQYTSSNHIAFERRGETLRAIDRGSRVGTWVNGQRLAAETPRELGDGDVVRIAGTVLVYRARFTGSERPSAPLGRMHSPFGLRTFAERVARLGPAMNNIMIEGETGTGKELAAEYIRDARRARLPFGKVNMAAIPAATIESYLFGHARGAFTGADTAKPGLFVDNDGGTVFLDEFGESSPDMQAKLLRFLQDREIQPVGGKPRTVDLMVIAGTNRALDADARNGTFRYDLLMRFATARLQLPPLRERREDIIEIAQATLAELGDPIDLRRHSEAQAIEQLLLYRWDGNGRELQGKLVDVLQRTEGEEKRLPHWAVTAALAPKVAGAANDQPRASSSRADYTREQVVDALGRSNGNQTKAAKMLSLSRPQLLRLMKKHRVAGSSTED